MVCAYCEKEHQHLVVNELAKVEVCTKCNDKLTLKLRGRIRGYRPKERRAHYELPKRLREAAGGIENLLDTRDPLYPRAGGALVQGWFIRALKNSEGFCSRCHRWPWRYFFSARKKSLICARCWKKTLAPTKRDLVVEAAKRTKLIHELILARLPFPQNYIPPCNSPLT